jgi:putative ABC transport system permease protein
MNETFRLALSSLGVNKLRSFLTMSGITIGVFSVIGVMTAVSALRGSIETGLSFLGANMFQFGKVPTGLQVGGVDRHKYESRRNLTLEQANHYVRLMAGTAPVVCLKVFETDNSAIQAVYGGRKTTPGLTFGGTNEYFLAANQYSIELGRNFTGSDTELARPVAIIGQDVARKLFPSESPLGKQIRTADHAYLVIGTFASKGSMFGQSEDAIVMVPLTRFLSDFGAQKYTVNIATQAPSQALYNETVDEGIAALRLARGLRPDQPNDFELYSNDSLIAAFAKIADVVRAGAFVISGIALLAAGVGIMNIMLVSVTERTKEIGIRKAIGARKASILAQFLVESVVISVAGGVVGILIGALAGNALALALSAAVVFPWGWAAAGLLVCSAIGIGFGLYPAWKASSLDPIEALRYE